MNDRTSTVFAARTAVARGRSMHAAPAPRGLFRAGMCSPRRTTVAIVARLDNPGRWMAHCHILEHAALGMMSEIVVRGAR